MGEEARNVSKSVIRVGPSVSNRARLTQRPVMAVVRIADP